MAIETNMLRAALQEVKAAQEAELLRLPNVVGVGVGVKEQEGERTGELAVVVYVERKVPRSGLSRREVVPKTLRGPATARVAPYAASVSATNGDSGASASPSRVPTDVKEVGRIEAQSFSARVRPARPGYSLGHFAITAGTFGCLVRSRAAPEQVYILSNSHVLANSNEARPGDPVLQPGSFDGGAFPDDVVATLEAFVPIRFDGLDAYNLVDAALARPQDMRLVVGAAAGLGLPTGTAEAELEMTVVKSGRTTQVTTGTVIDIDATVNVNFGSRVATFRHQILTTNMSAGGDSGSLLLSEARQGVGLLFAGSPQITVHNHLANVLLALGVELVTA